MPIDARIPLGVQPFQLQSQAQSLQQAMQMRESVEGLKDRQLDRQEKERQRQEQEAIRQALRETGGDLEKALPKIRTVSPTTALGIENTLSERRTRQAQEQSALLAHGVKMMDFTGQVIGAAHDQPTWDLALGTINKMHDDLRIPRPSLPTTYDANIAKTLYEATLSNKEKLEAAQLTAAGGASTDAEQKRLTWAREKTGNPKLQLSGVTTEMRHAFEDQEAEAASKRAGGSGKPRTTYERALLRWAQGIDPTVETLTDVDPALERRYQDEEDARKARNRTPPRVGPTSGERGVAERDKDDALRKAEADYDDSNQDNEAEAKLEARKLEIQNSYRGQLGMQPVTRLNDEWIRKELVALLRQYKAETEPERKAQYLRKMAAKRALLTGE